MKISMEKQDFCKGIKVKLNILRVLLLSFKNSNLVGTKLN
jgi:hypothetical protein